MHIRSNLIVDLDNSLIKSDYLLECFMNYFSKNIFAPLISFFVYLRGGKVGLKKFLHEQSDILIKNLPYNAEVIRFIYDWKKQHPNAKVYLISASYHDAVHDIAQFLNCFDGWFGTEDYNLKSEVKLKKIEELTHQETFTYIGDSVDDLVIWKNAEQCVLVNTSKRLTDKVLKINSLIEVIKDQDANVFKEILKTIRVHQWAKNTLLFVPAVLALTTFFDSLVNLALGFIAFSFIASAFYILNDLFDIESDRNHHSKKNRSFASGSLSIFQGFGIFLCLILLAIQLASNLSQSFQICLLVYSISTFTYSKYLKKIPILDIFTLSFLFQWRVITGGVLAGISVSNWLLTFSGFFFLFLAAVKRWIELKQLKSNSIPGRGYGRSDLPFICQLSYFSGLISVLIICLYIESQQAQALYDSTRILWFIPVVLMYWILETLFKVERGQVDDDPVKYALTSKTSYVSLLVFISIMVVAAR